MTLDEEQEATLRRMEMSLTLSRPEEPKVFCSSYRSNGRGYIVHGCSFHAGHENDHRDVHSGATWS